MKNIYLYLILFFTVLLAALTGCGRTEKIVIITTNDMHSSFERFPRLAQVVADYRADKSVDHVLLIDAGDRWTGNPYVDMAEEPGMPIIELMNELGYDYATLGNHEFDMGMELLADRIDRSKFKNIIANADFTATPLSKMAPYVIFKAGKTRVAMFGLITNAVNGHPAGKDENFVGAKFFDPVETAVKYRHLRDSSDLFIALTHTGIDIDTLVAAAVPELDLIIGGHTHTVIPNGRRDGRVLTTQTGSRLRYVGVTTVTTKKGKVQGIENHLVDLDSIDPSPKYTELAQKIKSNPELARSIGSVASDMNKIDLMNLFADIMRVGTGSQLAFYNLGSMRISELKTGDVTVGDVFSAEPFKNAPVTMMMTLEEIKELIMNKFNSTGGESHTMDIYPSGMTYTVLTDGNGDATDIVFQTNAKPDRKGYYKVAMSDYVDGQYDFPKRGTGTPSGLFITDLVMDYFAKNSPVKADTENRVKIEQNY